MARMQIANRPAAKSKPRSISMELLEAHGSYLLQFSSANPTELPSFFIQSMHSSTQRCHIPYVLIRQARK